MADNPTVNGVSVAGDDVAGVIHQLVVVEHGPADAPTRVTTTAPLPTRHYDGTYGYAAGTTAGTVDVPVGARLKRVSVIANASSATTVTIGGGATITIPAGGSFDEQIPGEAVGADVVIAGGAPQSYYVSWTQ